RHLVRSPQTFKFSPIDFGRRRPSFRRSQYDHWPARTRRNAGASRFVLCGFDLSDAMIERRCHGLMHARWIRALDKTRCVAIAVKEIFAFFVADAREQSGIVNLVTVEIENRQDRAVSERIEKLIDVPGSRQRSGLGFTVTDYGSDD